MMPGRHEQRRLERRVVHDVEDAGDDGERRVEPEQQRDEPEVADRRVGEQALEVVLEDRDEGAEQQRREPAPSTTIQNHGSVPPSAGYSRASRNTPAFTIVAECR